MFQEFFSLIFLSFFASVGKTRRAFRLTRGLEKEASGTKHYSIALKEDVVFGSGMKHNNNDGLSQDLVFSSP